MNIKIEIKNKTNWLLTIIGLIAIVVLSILILFIIPLFSVQETYLMSILSYVMNVSIFIAFFILFLTIWLWNTFGKTILNIDEEKIIVIKKFKLFSKPKIYLKEEVEKIEIKDYRIEKSKYYTRYNFSLTNATNSIVILTNNEIRMVDWITKEKAIDIVEKIENTWKKNYCRQHCIGKMRAEWWN